jgi:hypothetical protein
MEHGRVLDAGGEEQVPVAGTPGQQTEYAEVHGVRAAGGERHLVGADPETLGHHGARVVEQQPGLAGRTVQSPRVGVPATEGLLEHLSRSGVQRLPRSVVQIRT